MRKNIFILIAIIALLAFAGIIVCSVFETTFAELTIDWLAFAAGIFLVVEGLYRFFTSKGDPFSRQFCRMTRAVIGMCVFTIHLLQFMRY